MGKYFVLIAAVLVAGRASACDLCSCYCAMDAGKGEKGLFASVAEQHTHYGTMQENGHRVANEVDQRLDSLITQFIVGWQFHDRVGVQVTVPYINRSFRRPEGFAIDRGTEAGLGDVTLSGLVRVLDWQEAERALRVSLLGGVKFPTGNSARIREETMEMEVPGAPESGIHGHDLALGSGSVDGIVGGAVSVRWRRLYATANVQYAIRSEGDFDYRYANDLVWSGGPGWYLVSNSNTTLGLQFNISGEHKGKDTFEGAKAEDTAVTMVYLGPELQVTWRNWLNAELGVDVPVVRDNSALQIVPDLRVRAAVTWRF